MQPLTTRTAITLQAVKRKKSFILTMLDQKYLYFMSLPFIIWLLIFNYVPLWGWLMAFQNYKPGKNILQQKWVGLSNFHELFADERFYLVLRNTLAMSIMGLIVGFTVPIIFALLINELRGQLFKRTIQTVSYLPHFVSWVVVAGLVSKMLSTDGGAVNQAADDASHYRPSDPVYGEAHLVLGNRHIGRYVEGNRLEFHYLSCGHGRD